jgi:hypothetical protein
MTDIVRRLRQDQKDDLSDRDLLKAAEQEIVMLRYLLDRCAYLSRRSDLVGQIEGLVEEYFRNMRAQDLREPPLPLS